jgi:hypothetical protein
MQPMILFKGIVLTSSKIPHVTLGLSRPKTGSLGCKLDEVKPIALFNIYARLCTILAFLMHDKIALKYSNYSHD